MTQPDPTTNRFDLFPRWGAVCMSASLVCFTANALMLKHLGDSQHVSPWLALTFRASIGLLLVIAFFNRNGQIDFRRAATNRLHICRGLFGIVGTIAYYFTIPALGPGKATLISNTYVVIAALFAVWILGESLRMVTILGNILAAFGLFLLLGLSPTQLGSLGWYEGLAVVGAFFAAAAVVAIKQLTTTDNSATIFVSQCIFVLAAALPPTCWYWTQLTWSAFAYLGIAGVCASLGQLAMTEGFRHLSVSVGGAFQILVPVGIALGGITFFGETFSPIQILGGVMILIGCYGAIVIR